MGFFDRMFGPSEPPPRRHADHYIIRLLPPVWGVSSELVSRILVANNCVEGSASTDVDVNDRAQEKGLPVVSN